MGLQYRGGTGVLQVHQYGYLKPSPLNGNVTWLKKTSLFPQTDWWWTVCRYADNSQISALCNLEADRHLQKQTVWIKLFLERSRVITCATCKIHVMILNVTSFPDGTSRRQQAPPPAAPPSAVTLRPAACLQRGSFRLRNVPMWGGISNSPLRLPTITQDSATKLSLALLSLYHLLLYLHCQCVTYISQDVFLLPFFALPVTLK